MIKGSIKEIDSLACNFLYSFSAFCHSYIYFFSLHLKRHDDHGGGALGGGLPGPVPDGVLRLQGEEEAGGKVVHLEDAGADLCGVILNHGVTGARDGLPVVLKVPVRHPDDVVDDGEQEPGQVEAGGEHEDAVAPAGV